MKKTRFYPTVWQAMVFPSGVVGQWDNDGKRVRELILKNDRATELGISEMELNLLNISAIDYQGAEYPISNFQGQHYLPIKGLASGHFLRSKSVMLLPEGKYEKLRFYIGNEHNRFIYCDGSSEFNNNLGFLDFTIENGLKIPSDGSNEVKLWFDFAPYKISRHFKGLIELFKNSRMPRPNFAGSFGH